MQKKHAMLFVTLLLALNAGMAGAEHKQDHATATTTTVPAAETHFPDIKKYGECSLCGMSREKFAHSRALLTYADGTTVAVCSIACLATELKANPKKTVKHIRIADYNSKKLIDAKTAVWVIGGTKRGVMTRTAKWAFSTKRDAESFVSTYGGKISGYAEALRLASE